MTWRGLRAAWFQIHKWIGIALCLVLVPIALSGSLLIAHDWWEDAEHADAGPTAILPMSVYITAAEPLLPLHARIAAIELPDDGGRTVTFRAALPGDGAKGSPPARIQLDAATARPAATAVDDDDFFEGTLHHFHESLLIPLWGRSIVGWLGVALLLSAGTGLWLWWPYVGGLRRAFRWGRGKYLDYNLHHQIGFWIAAPLAILSLSGVWLAFPAFFGAIVGDVPARAMRGGVPLSAPRFSVDAAILRLGVAPFHEIDFPTDRNPQWIVRFGDEGRLARALDDTTGTIVPSPAARDTLPTRGLRVLHEGDRDLGPIWRLIAILGGLAPAILAVTGLIMWLRTRKVRAA